MKAGKIGFELVLLLASVVAIGGQVYTPSWLSCAAGDSSAAACSLENFAGCANWTVEAQIDVNQINATSGAILLGNGGQLPYLDGFYVQITDGNFTVSFTLGESLWQATFNLLRISGQKTIRFGFTAAIGLVVYDVSTSTWLATTSSPSNRTYVPLPYDFEALVSSSAAVDCSSPIAGPILNVSFQSAYTIPVMSLIIVPELPSQSFTLPQVVLALSGRAVAQSPMTISFSLTNVVANLPVYYTIDYGDDSPLEQTSASNTLHVWQNSGSFRVQVTAYGLQFNRVVATGSLTATVVSTPVILMPIANLILTSVNDAVYATVIGGSSPISCTFSGNALSVVETSATFIKLTAPVNRSQPGVYVDVVSCSNPVNNLVVNSTFIKPATTPVVITAQTGQSFQIPLSVSPLVTGLQVIDVTTGLPVAFTSTGSQVIVSPPTYGNVTVLQTAIVVIFNQNAVLTATLINYAVNYQALYLIIPQNLNSTANVTVTFDVLFSDVLARRTLNVTFGDQSANSVFAIASSSRTRYITIAKNYMQPGIYNITVVLSFGTQQINATATITVSPPLVNADTETLLSSLGNINDANSLVAVANILSGRLDSNSNATAVQEMRGAIVQALGNVPINSVDQLQGVSGCMNKVTNSELSTSTKKLAASAVAKTASMVKNFEYAPVETLQSVATDLISCVGNVLPTPVDVTCDLKTFPCPEASISSVSEQICLVFTPAEICEILTYNYPSDAQLIFDIKLNDYLAATQQNDQSVTTTGLAAAGTLSGTLVNASSNQGGSGGVSFSSPTLAASAQKLSDGAAETSMRSGSASVSLPASATSKRGAASVRVLTSAKNMYTWGKNSFCVNSPTVSIDAAGADGSETAVNNLDEPISLFIARNYTPQTKIYQYWGNESLTTLNSTCHKITVNGANMTVQARITINSDRSTCISAWWNFGTPGVNGNYSFYQQLPKEAVNQTFCGEPNDLLDYQFTFFPPAESSSVAGDYYLCFNAVDCDTNEAFGFTYTLDSVITSCTYWNNATNMWDYEGTVVGAYTTPTCMNCLTTHLTSFSSQFVVAPNTIDFSSVFGKFGDLSQNAAVFATIIVILGLFFISMVVAHRYDERDFEKKHVTALVDNQSDDTYFYMVSVETGRIRGAGTKSTVNMILSGEEFDSDIRTLDDGVSTEMPRSSRRNFLMSVPKCLGPLLYLRIWHDNSGGSWYLCQVTVTDVQTRERFRFICEDWLAVDVGDGKVERLLPLASTDDLKSVTRLFAVEFRSKLANDHLWFSVFTKPARSAFTRAQRIACCVSLLFTSMIANAMFFGTGSSSSSSGSSSSGSGSGSSDSESASAATIALGPLTIETHQLFISVAGAIIVAPINIIIVILFRRSDNPSREIARVKAADDERKQNPLTASNPSIRTESSFMTIASIESSTVELNPKDTPAPRHSKSIAPPKPRTFMLPPAFLYVAWAICILTILASAFFTILYSMQWGPSISNAWLLTFFLSLFESVLLIQPLKVFAIAAVISCILRKLDDDETPEYDSIDVVEEAQKLKREIQEQLMLGGDSTTRSAMPRRAISYLVHRELPSSQLEPNSTAVERMRNARKRAAILGVALKELAIYGLFFFVILFIVSNTRATNSYQIYRMVNGRFLQNFIAESDAPATVNNRTAVIQYLYKQFAYNIYAPDWYNGRKATWREKLTINDDYMNYRIGAPRIRQVRLAPTASCTVPLAMDGIIDYCLPSYQIFYSDTDSYDAGWQPLGSSNSSETSYQTALCGSTMPASAWQYTPSPQGIPYVGETNAYLPGGYDLDLCLSYNNTVSLLDKALAAGWLDERTSALFIEFTLLNLASNSYTSVTLLAEFLATGGVVTSADVKTFVLFEYAGSIGPVIFVFELLFLAFFVYYLVVEIRKIRKDRIDYLTKFGNLFEVIFLALCVVVVIIFSIKTGWAYAAAAIVTQAPPEQYVDMRPFATLVSGYDCLLAFLCFLAIVKFIKLLNFDSKSVIFIRNAMKLAFRNLRFCILAFFIYLLAATSLAYLVFSSNLSKFRNFVQSIESLISLLVGVNMYDLMESSAGSLGAFLYMTIIFTIYSFSAMFMTIIINAFQKQRIRERNGQAEKIKEEDQVNLLGFLWDSAKSLIGLN